MCFCMVITFMVSWLPMQAITIYRFYDNERLKNFSYFGDLFFVCHLIAVSRSFVNPFIYAWTNVRFREGFIYFLCVSCLKKPRNLAKPDLLHLANNKKYRNVQNSKLIRFGSEKLNNKQQQERVLTYRLTK